LFCQNGRIGGGSRAADGFPRGAAPGLAERVVIGADRALAAPQRPALVAIHGGKPLAEIGEDDGHLLRRPAVARGSPAPCRAGPVSRAGSRSPALPSILMRAIRPLRVR